MRNDALHGGSPLAAHGPGWLAPTIQKAHERSEIFGLHTTTRPDYDVLPSPEPTSRSSRAARCMRTRCP